MTELAALARSIKFALNAEKDLNAVYLQHKEFKLSGRGCNLAKRVIGKHSKVGHKGIYFGSPLQDAILITARQLHDRFGILEGDHLWNALAACYGVTVNEICARPAGNIPAHLPRFAKEAANA